MTRTRRRLARLLRGAAGIAALIAAVGGGIWIGTAGLPIALAALRSERFHLRKIDWVGLQALEARDLLRLLPPRGGTALVDLDVEALSARVEQHPRVERCHVVRLPPDRMIFWVVEREPVGRVAGQAQAFDATGARFPLVPGEEDGLVPVKGDVRLAVPLLLAALDQGIDLSEADARGAQDVRFRVRGSAVLIRAARDAKRVLRDWERVRAAGVLTRYRPREIDLRFRGSAALRGLRTSKEGGEHVSSRGADRRS